MTDSLSPWPELTDETEEPVSLIWTDARYNPPCIEMIRPVGSEPGATRRGLSVTPFSACTAVCSLRPSQAVSVPCVCPRYAKRPLDGALCQHSTRSYAQKTGGFVLYVNLSGDISKCPVCSDTMCEPGNPGFWKTTE